jgi:glycine dehydrogenase subunit 2
MIEPTETESRETLDRFARILLTIADEDPQILHDAPLSTPISRPDEVAAARTPILRWKPAPIAANPAGDGGTPPTTTEP